MPIVALQSLLFGRPDLTLFDADKVADRATYEQPALPTEGFRFVVVNGTPVVRDGRIVDGVTPGRPARAAH